MGLIELPCLRARSDREILVQDITMLEQDCTGYHTEIRDEAMAEYYKECYAQDMDIQEFGCVWLHTHPSDDTTPSGLDETTFAETFSRHPWAAMLILGQNGSMYGRVKNNKGLVLSQQVDVVIDWRLWEDFVSPASWSKDYKNLVHGEEYQYVQRGSGSLENQKGTDLEYITIEKAEEVAAERRKNSVNGHNTYSGLGTLQTLRCRWDQFNELFKDGDEAQLLARRASIVGEMNRGGMYEVEVRLLLWLNWWLKQWNRDTVYPSRWTTIFQENNLGCSYEIDGPTLYTISGSGDLDLQHGLEDIKGYSDIIVGNMTDVPVTEYDLLEDTKALCIAQFGEGIELDVQDKVQDKVQDGTAIDVEHPGHKIREDFMADIVANGESFEVSGEVFVAYGNRTYHPKTKCVLSTKEEKQVLASATAQEESGDANAKDPVG